MSCKKTFLPLYTGGDLPGWKQLYTRFHLRRCEECRLELNRLTKSNRLFSSAMVQKEPKISAVEMWGNIRNQLPETPEQPVQKIVRKENLIRKPAFAIAGFTIVMLALLSLKTGNFLNTSEESSITKNSDGKVTKNYPIVENVEPNITVMTFQTDDPKIKIVWFFEND